MEESFKKEVINIKKRLFDRGYGERDVSIAEREVCSMSREDMLFSSKHDKNMGYVFSTPYSSDFKISNAFFSNTFPFCNMMTIYLKFLKKVSKWFLEKMSP